MNKQSAWTLYVLIIATLVFAVAPALAAPAPAQAAGKLPAPAWPHVRHSGWHGLKLSWDAVDGADGYAVYRWSKAKKRYVRRAWTKKTSWRDAGLRADKRYSYRVAAYKKAKGKKRVGKRSYKVSAVAYSKGAAVVNPGAPKVEARSLVMELARRSAPEYLGAWTHVGASRNGSLVGGRKCRAFSDAVRWVSSRPSVVKVERDGGRQEAWARRVGRCTLRAVAANGARGPAVRVRVRDLTLPASFSDPGVTDPEVFEWLNDMRGQMSAVIRASAKSGTYGEIGGVGSPSISYCGFDGTSDSAFRRWAKSGPASGALGQLLSHEVDGIRPYDIQVRDGFTLFFESETRIGVTYTVSYLPEYDGDEIAPSWTIRTSRPHGRNEPVNG